MSRQIAIIATTPSHDDRLLSLRAYEPTACAADASKALGRCATLGDLLALGVRVVGSQRLDPDRGGVREWTITIGSDAWALRERSDDDGS
jgi:hypothetical protein